MSSSEFFGDPVTRDIAGKSVQFHPLRRPEWKKLQVEKERDMIARLVEMSRLSRNDEALGIGLAKTALESATIDDLIRWAQSPSGLGVALLCSANREGAQLTEDELDRLDVIEQGQILNQVLTASRGSKPVNPTGTEPKTTTTGASVPPS